MQNRVYIIVEGGLIQNVLADDPETVDVVVIDYDTEGATEEEIAEGCTMIPQITGGEVEGEEPAWVSRWPSEAIGQVDEWIQATAIVKFGEA